MKGQPGQVSSTASRAAMIEDALGSGEAYLDPALVQRARATVDRAIARVELGSEHTVVALVGATGSGKSSLFNALAGMDIAEVGARRPMTRQPMAALWGDGGDPVLDWLGVPHERRMRRESVLDADHQAPLHGLILLDLPDHDSTEAIHQVEVDRLVRMVDLMIWVVDPQKYADDALHSRYLQQLTGHAGSMIVVLNQIDRLGPEEVGACVRDLRRLLDGDGLETVRQLALSARRGDGVDDLRDVLAQVVQERSAVLDRVGADLQNVTDEIVAELAPAEPDDDAAGADVLIDRLAAAAGTPLPGRRRLRALRRRGWLRVGWPVLKGLRRLRPDAVGRLGSSVDEQDLRVIATSLVPSSAPSQRAEVALAVDAATDSSAKGLPPRWAEAVRASAHQPGAGLVDSLDDAVAGVGLQLAPPIWWRLVQAAQYLLIATSLVGAAWLCVIGGRKLAGQGVDGPMVSGLPLALVLFVAGFAGGALLAGLSGWALALGAARRRTVALARLTDAVEQVATQLVLSPIREVLAVHRATRQALTHAGAPPIAMTAPEPADVADDDRPVTAQLHQPV